MVFFASQEDFKHTNHILTGLKNIICNVAYLFVIHAVKSFYGNQSPEASALFKEFCERDQRFRIPNADGIARGFP